MTTRTWLAPAAPLALALLALAACSTPRTAGAPVTQTTSNAFVPGQSSGYGQVPPFARLGFGSFSREDAVAIALREWRLWGQPVDDDPPGTRPPPTADSKPERFPGLWQRVGEYWWEGMDQGTSFAYWTGKHNENGTVFPAGQDSRFAWSAAFISYIMRVAGAGDRFPYSAAHVDYINMAKTGGAALAAERPTEYAPQPGDLVCHGRGRSGNLTFDDLPAPSFPGHCDFVVATRGGELTVIGGNVDDAVTEKHIPTTAAGLVTDPATGAVVDSRYPWFVVLKVLYDT